jgi:hypothetical protein
MKLPACLALLTAATGCSDASREGNPQLLSGNISQAALDRGSYSTDLVFNVGLDLFVHPFTCAEGGGTRVGGACVHDRLHGPESQSCIDCHNTPVRDGAGTLATNVFRGGTSPSDGIQRNTPHLFGCGYVEALAREMTAELASEKAAALARAAASGADTPASLDAKGTHFGQLVAHADGRVDVAPSGIDADLVVRPYMAKGFVATMRDQAKGAFFGHLGIQPTETVGVGVDGDGDGVVDELDPGRLTSVVVYEALLAVPSYKPVSASADGGLAIFRRIGCDGCHAPLQRLQNPTLFLPDPADPTRAQGLMLDLSAAVDVPRLDRLGGDGPVLVPLFSDLKRHDLGPELADPVLIQGVPTAQFLTTRLWGVGSTAPYLHDGRAATLGDAILLHGGEAAATRDGFIALSDADRGALLDFLASLVLERDASNQTLPPGAGY